MPPLSIQKKFPLVCHLDIALLSLTLSPFASLFLSRPSSSRLFLSDLFSSLPHLYFTPYQSLQHICLRTPTPPLLIPFSPFLCSFYSILYFSPSTQQHRWNELMMCLIWLSCSFTTIFPILLFIYWGVLHFAESQNHLLYLHFQFFSLFFGSCAQLLEKKCADLYHCYSHGQ